MKIAHLTFQFEDEENEKVFICLIGLSTVQTVRFISLVGFALGQVAASVSWLLASKFTAQPPVLPMKNQAMPAVPVAAACYAPPPKRSSAGCYYAGFPLAPPPRRSTEAPALSRGLPLKPGGGASFRRPPPAFFGAVAAATGLPPGPEGMFAKLIVIFSPSFKPKSASI